MAEMPYGGAGTAEAAAPAAGDSPRRDEADPGAGYDQAATGPATEDQLPTRQDARDAAWGDSPVYDEADLGAGYDGDLGALSAEDQLPARPDSRHATWGDSPEYDEGDLGAAVDADDGALAAEDRLPARQDSRDAAWGDDPGYDDEADLAAEYDGDLDALTSEDQAPDPGDDNALDRGNGDQGRTAAQEATEAADKPGEPADEALDASPADPESELKELKAEYEAGLKDLKTELQALKDLWQPVSDAPAGAGRDADQPRAGGLPVDQDSAEAAERHGDRPGLWSNAKYALYGAVGTTAGMALLDQFAPGVSRVVDDIIVGVPTLIGALVPTLREGWKRKHDDSPAKR